jgi:two-component system OmpR family response regulator
MAIELPGPTVADDADLGDWLARLAGEPHAMKRPRILVIEDDESSQESYKLFFETLHSKEFAWALAPNGGRAFSLLRARDEAPFDAVILDWNLPDMRGLDILVRLRRDPATCDLPVVVVTGREELRERVLGLENGADDYFVKPVELDELLARLRGLVKRRKPAPAQPKVLAAHDLVLDLLAAKLTVHGKSVHLFKKELGLLVLFLRRPNMIHSSAYLWETVWGYANPNGENIVEVAISNLRKKLGPRWAVRLETHRSRGYLLNTETRV